VASDALTQAKLLAASANSTITTSTRILHVPVIAFSLRTSNLKYLEEAAGFYEAIHVRGYLNAPGLEEAHERFSARLVLVNLFLGRFERALLLAQNSASMRRLCPRVYASADSFKFSQNLPSTFPHALILAGRELSLRYCWLHMCLDRTEPATPRTVLQAPSFPEAMAAVSALLCRHRKLLIWADGDAETVLSPTDLDSFRQRGYEICSINSRIESNDPFIQHITSSLKSILNDS
jgi:hypothetical protein